MSLLTQQNQRCSQSSWQTYLGFDRTWSLDCYFYHQQIIYWLALKTSTVDYRLIIHCLLWILCIFRDIKLEMLDLFLVSGLPGHPLQFTDRVSVMTDFYWHSLFILPPKKSVYIDGYNLSDHLTTRVSCPVGRSSTDVTITSSHLIENVSKLSKNKTDMVIKRPFYDGCSNTASVCV